MPLIFDNKTGKDIVSLRKLGTKKLTFVLLFVLGNFGLMEQLGPGVDLFFSSKLLHRSTTNKKEQMPPRPLSSLTSGFEFRKQPTKIMKKKS